MERNDDELLLDLLMRWEELRNRGHAISAGDLCRDCPQLRDELSKRIEALEATAWLEKPSDDEDPPDGDEPHPVPVAPKVFSGRYRLDALIAEGGFAQVWKATDLELKRLVAVKIPKPSRLQSTDAFLAEAQRVARLKHDRIVAVYDVGRENDSCFIVSEYVEGGSLKSILARGPLPIHQVITWVRDIAEALQYAHDNGVVHRDIKPANILIDHHSRAVLADFGIAQSPMKAVKSVGTLKYMSPEQLTGDRVDGRADIFSLAVVLHECLTGRIPHTNKSLPLPDATRSTQNVATDMPRPLRRLCKRALSKDPAHRPASAREFGESLSLAYDRSRASKWLVLACALVTLALAALVGSRFAYLATGVIRPQVAAVLPDWTRNNENLSEVLAVLSSVRSVCHSSVSEIAEADSPYTQRGGGVVAPDGTVICMPTDTGSLLAIDPVHRTAHTIASLSSPSGLYFGGVLAPDGCIYGIPHTATDILRFDPKTNQATTFGQAPGKGAYWGGVVGNDGKIYCVPSAASDVLVIDPVSQHLSRFGELDAAQYKYSGGVLAPNGKIYCMPDRAKRILVIDPATHSLSLLDEDLGDGAAKAFGGVLAHNGKIYSGLAGAGRLIVIDPNTDTVSFIPNLPAGKYVGGSLGPDGKIYCIPNHAGPVLMIDPLSHEVQSLRGPTPTGEYWGSLLTPHGCIVGIPWNAKRVLMIDCGLKIPKDWALSRIYNKF